MGTSFERRERPDAFQGLIEPTSRISRRSTEELKAEIATTDEFGMPVKSPAMEMASLAAAQNITATGGAGSPRGRGELAQLQVRHAQMLICVSVFYLHTWLFGVIVSLSVYLTVLSVCVYVYTAPLTLTQSINPQHT